MGKMKTEKRVDYKKELKCYQEFYGLIKAGPEKGIGISHLKQAFDNCIAFGARLSFGPTKEKILLSLRFLKCAEGYMYLGGFNEEPDDMPWVLAAIKTMAMQNYSKFVYSENPNKTTEVEIEQQIISNWEAIDKFSGYAFLESQKTLKHGDRIDIFAVEKETDRPVIIEIKKGNCSGHKQLRSYAVGFENPILINISQSMPITQRDDIIYYDLDSLGEAFAELTGQSKVIEDCLLIDQPNQLTGGKDDN